MRDKIRKFAENVKRVFQDSFYVSMIKNNKTVIGMCFLISAFLVLLTYPGVIYSDSYTRIGMADEIEKWVHAFFRGHTDLTEGKTWLTITPSYFIELSNQFVGSVALYTFFHAFCFLFVSILFGQKMLGAKKRWSCMIVFSVPVFFAYSVYFEAGVGCATGIMSLCLLIWKWNDIDHLQDQILTVLFFIGCSFIVFGFRANAFTVLPVFFVEVFLNKKNRKKSFPILVSIFLGLWLTSMIPKILNVNTMSSYAAGFLWETISVIQEMDEEKQKEYLAFVDDIFGEGITKKALEANVYDTPKASINHLMEVISADAISKQENAEKILKKYLELIRLETWAYSKTKWKFISQTMGIRYPINNLEYDYNRWDNMGTFGFNDSRQRAVFVDYFNSYMEYMRIFRMPWLLYIWALCLIIVWRVRFASKEEAKSINIFETAFLTAVFYYGSYLLDTQSFEFRYFFPSWLMLFFVIVALMGRMIRKMHRKYLNHLGILAAVFFGVVTIHGGVGILNRTGDQALDTVKSKGMLLFETDGQKVYFLDDKLYFMAEQKADTGYTYFLHYFTADGAMSNYDFTYTRDQMYTTRGRGKIVEKKIPLDDIVRIEYGQYYGNTRFWEHSVSLEDLLTIPKCIDVLEFTDDHWTNGYSNHENCFLAKELTLQNCMVAGKKLKFHSNGGKTVHVTNVEEVSGYLRVYTDTVLDRSVRRYEVIY